MAAAAEDDDAWLYGENEKADAENREEGGDDSRTAAEDSVVVIIKDEVPQVTIRDIKSAPYAAYPGPPPTVNLNIKRGAPFGGNLGPGGGVGPGGAKTKGLDVDEVALLNGVSIYEFNIESLEDKPWRKPGADITDYFNYGFNEDTWKIYCDRQRKLRSDNNVPVKSALHLVGKDPLLMPIPPVNENSKYTGMASVPVLGSKKAGPPPGRKMSGSIDVIGGGAPSLPSRRPGGGKEGVIQVIGSVDSGSMGGLSLPPTHVPPPGYMGVPLDASNMSIPPPIPGMIPGVPPPGYDTGSFPPPRFTHPPPPIPGAGGDRSYDDRSSFYNGSGYGQPYGDDGGGGSEHRGDKEERHRSSRRRHHRDEDEEEERRSSKHKHKRSKKERVAVVEEPEAAAEGSQDAAPEAKAE
ncbi:pre-mRNA 3'-end-processing factor FIP1, putative [Ixodes scapularis]|uniref:Pre-mRNA 3'-end-processing factor FIP1, putative n=1 Tax=Ixodes scapularis TaxID=6945 RepID=B7P5H2_IXOSC|nr:pre-mRNA 3'-end-processing factor FIP1, putative [Ixodes scapularis]|eukprot:XP_002407380.1 pre-mRNA 3'-end-processing factor FIP1, putative [Ixodes scapularis]